MGENEEKVEVLENESTSNVELGENTDIDLEHNKMSVETEEGEGPGPDDVVMSESELNNMLTGGGLGGGLGSALGGLLGSALNNQNSDEIKKVLESQTELFERYDKDISNLEHNLDLLDLKVNNLEQSSVINGTFTKILTKISLGINFSLIIAVILIIILK